MLFCFSATKGETKTMRVIAKEYFSVLISLEKTTDYVRERQHIKHSLLDAIADVLGRSYRKAKKVAAVIDEIAYKASDRGFSFNGRETLANKVGVSLPTVDRAIKLLKESGRVFVGYRENPNSNGAKTPVIIFKDHANYKRIAAILKINDNVNDKVGISETPSKTSVEGTKKVSTNLYRKQENNNKHPSFGKIVDYVALKVSDAVEKNGKGISFLSSYIDKVIAGTESNAFYEANRAYHDRLALERKRARSLEAPSFNWLNV